MVVCFRKKIPVSIVDNDTYEDDEQFFVELSNVHANYNEHQKVPAKLGSAGLATVLIIDDDHGKTST